MSYCGQCEAFPSHFLNVNLILKLNANDAVIFHGTHEFDSVPDRECGDGRSIRRGTKLFTNS